MFNNPVRFTDSSGMCPDGTCPEGTTLDEVQVHIKSRGVSSYGNEIAGMMQAGKTDTQIRNHFNYITQGSESSRKFNEAFANRSFYHNYYHGGMSNAQSASALLENTDANDALILLSSLFNNSLKFDSSAEGGISTADEVDQSLAAGGIFLPVVSGSALRQLKKVEKITSEITVYRAFGGDSRAQGFSWTPIDPRKVKDFRNLAGLPSGGESGVTNTANFLIKGKVNPANIIEIRGAKKLDGNIGGLPEFIIDPSNVRLTDFKVLKP